MRCVVRVVCAGCLGNVCGLNCVYLMCVVYNLCGMYTVDLCGMHGVCVCVCVRAWYVRSYVVCLV